MIHHIDVPVAMLAGDRVEGPISACYCFHATQLRPERGLFYKVSVAVKHWTGNGSITFHDDHTWPDYGSMLDGLIKHGFEERIAAMLAQFVRTYIQDKILRDPV